MKKLILVVLMMFSSLYAVKKDVTVSIVPQKYFVEKIAGDKINVTVMVKPGFSPATYEPKTSQMKKLSNSSAYFAIGVAFEHTWLDKFKNANKEMIIVHTDSGIKKLEMLKHSHHEEQHNDDEDHENHADHEEESHDAHADESLDPHIWNDPILVKKQALTIYEALVRIDNVNSAYYKENYENFLKELDNLDVKLSKILKPYEHKAFMVFHPSWGYFAKRYSLEQVAIEAEGKEPKPKELVELIKDAQEHKIKIVFVSSQFSQKTAKIIAKNIKGNVLIIDPLASNWETNLIFTAEKIANTYK